MPDTKGRYFCKTHEVWGAGEVCWCWEPLQPDCLRVPGMMWNAYEDWTPNFFDTPPIFLTVREMMDPDTPLGPYDR